VVVRSASRLRPVTVAPGQVSAIVDELPLLAVAMAAADGTSEVRGAAELRVKESDRLAAMAAALTAAGARVEELADGWRVSRGRPRRADVVTLGDHRIAMAMAVAAWSGIAEGTTLDDPGCVGISYPGFWRDAVNLGIEA
jgi:3-phosphoshikimate 1-carboxyvinyltransferase